MRYFQGSKKACQARQAADSKHAGMPTKGTQVGGGIHVAMTDDPTSPGWTQHAKGIRKHPTKASLYAYQDDAGGSNLDQTWTVSVDVPKTPTVETR